MEKGRNEEKKGRRKRNKQGEKEIKGREMEGTYKEGQDSSSGFHPIEK